MKYIRKFCYIIILLIIINVVYFKTIEVKAFDTDGLNSTAQMTYYVESKENIVYYDIESDDYEIVYLEMGLFSVYNDDQYPLSRGYIVRNDEEIFHSDPDFGGYPFSMFSDDLAIIWLCQKLK